MTEEQHRALLIATLIASSSWGAAPIEVIDKAGEMADLILLVNHNYFLAREILEKKERLNELGKVGPSTGTPK